MVNFTPLKKINRKKINKFFLIANLFLILLISIVGLVYYNKTLQPTRPGAAQKKCSSIDNQKECNASCSPFKSNGKSYACKWLSAQNKCIESGNECIGGVKEEITEGLCSADQKKNGWFQCTSGIGDPKCTFCLKSSKRTCNEVLKERGCSIYYRTNEKCQKISNKCFKCVNNDGGLAYHYKCDKITNVGSAGCQDNGKFLGEFPGGEQKFCFDGNENDCGAEQIDWGNVFITRIGPVDCKKTSDTQTPTPTKTQTPTPTDTPIPDNTFTPTPTDNPTPTYEISPTPTIFNQPTDTISPTLTNNPTPSPTEIILVVNSNTPTSLPITDTPVQEIIQAGDGRSFLIFSIPIFLILLALFL